MDDDLMSYATNYTRNTSGLHPNLRGLDAYATLSTRAGAGINPNFRGLGDVPLTSFVIGPGGQFSMSTATTPTSASLWDQILTWMGSSTVIAGMPNSVVAIAAGVGILAFARRGKGRR
jgi:hypothetical protein